MFRWVGTVRRRGENLAGCAKRSAAARFRDEALNYSNQDGLIFLVAATLSFLINRIAEATKNDSDCRHRKPPIQENHFKIGGCFLTLRKNLCFIDSKLDFS